MMQEERIKIIEELKEIKNKNNTEKINEIKG